MSSDFRLYPSTQLGELVGELTNDLETSSQVEMLSGRMSATIGDTIPLTPTAETIIFNQIDVTSDPDMLAAYDETSGIFTAPEDGIYLISFSSEYELTGDGLVQVYITIGPPPGGIPTTGIHRNCTQPTPQNVSASFSLPVKVTSGTLVRVTQQAISAGGAGVVKYGTNLIAFSILKL
jgi:hypothetical protein